MTDEDLYFEIPGDEAPPRAAAPPPAASAPAPEPASRPPPPSAPPATPVYRRRNWRLTLVLAAIGVLLLVGIAAVLSFSVAISPSTANATYPYTVIYDVIFPAAEPVPIGNITLVAIPYPDRVSLSVDKVPYDIPINQTRQVSAKHATVTLLGVGLLSFDFVLETEYLGMVGQDAHFELGIRTSEQIPKFLIDRLLPPSVRARPA